MVSVRATMEGRGGGGKGWRESGWGSKEKATCATATSRLCSARCIYWCDLISCPNTSVLNRCLPLPPGIQGVREECCGVTSFGSCSARTIQSICCGQFFTASYCKGMQCDRLSYGLNLSADFRSTRTLGCRPLQEVCVDM